MKVIQSSGTLHCANKERVTDVLRECSTSESLLTTYWVAWQQENLGLLDPKDEGTTLF
jgi:hypothetical protein